MSKLREINPIVSCLTCIQVNSTPETVVDVCWEFSWNLSIIAEENEAVEHGTANPNHIMIQGIDWGFKLNGY